MKVLLLTILTVAISSGCNVDKGPEIQVIDEMTGVKHSYRLKDGDWFLEDGQWKDARNLVIAADAHAVREIERYRGAKQVAQDKYYDNRD